MDSLRIGARLAIGAALADSVGEAHLAYGEVVVSPDVDELVDARRELEAIAFALSDFADGGDGASSVLPLADKVGLALGSNLAVWRDRDDLAEPSSWTVTDELFAGFTGPFDVLGQAAGPVTVTIGVHPHCASPVPVAAPPELVHLRRVSLQPPEGSIDSCLQWSSVDVFVDDRGLIHGVSLDLWEP